MGRQDFGQYHCSIARTLDVIGDVWTPLILRDLYLGVDTFDDLVRDLGISRALLVARLAHLVESGVAMTEAYQHRPDRQRYRLTESGLDLVPVLLAITRWGDRWRAPEGAPIVFRHQCGEVATMRLRCDACGEEVHAGSVTALPGPGGRHAAGTVVVAERLAEHGAGEIAQ